MSSKITLSEIRTAVLDRCDMTNSEFPDTTQVDRYINNAIGELYDLLVNIFEDYLYTTTEITVKSSTESYSLPNNFYKLMKMFYKSGDYRKQLKRFNLADLSDEIYQTSNAVSDNRHLRYRLMGNKLIFHPIPSGSSTVEVWYIPEPTMFDHNGDDGVTIGFNVPTQWEEFLFVTAAISLLDREESDSSALRSTKAEIRQRIVTSAHNRDSGEPDTVQDVRRRFGYRGTRY